MVDAILVKLGGSNVDREVYVFTRNKAGSLDGFDDHLEGFFVGAEVWCKAAFVTDSSVVAFALEHSLQRMEHFGAHAQRFLEGFCAKRHDHEFLDVDVVVGVLAAVQDVHHWRWQNLCIGATDVAIQWQSSVHGSSLGASQRNAEDGVGAKFSLVVGAVEADQFSIDGGLIADVPADEAWRDLFVDKANGFRHALAEIAGFVAIAQFNSFKSASGCAGWHSSTAEIAKFSDDIDFYRWIATGIEDFSCNNTFNFCHFNFLLLLIQ